MILIITYYYWKGTGVRDSEGFRFMDCFHLTHWHPWLAQIPLSSMAIEAEDSSSTALAFRFPGLCARGKGLRKKYSSPRIHDEYVRTNSPILVINRLEPEHAVALFKRSPPCLCAAKPQRNHRRCPHDVWNTIPHARKACHLTQPQGYGADSIGLDRSWMCIPANT